MKTSCSKLAALAAVYDEHEVRRATYAGRDLSHEERRDLALAGLAQCVRENGGSIIELQRAGEICDDQLRLGATVGTAIRVTIEAMQAAEPAAAGV